MKNTLWMAYGWVLIWLALVLATFAWRGPIPIDETRYLTVAWEMWQRNDFLVPYLNGQPYSHKPPLLFWIYHLGWAISNVNDWWPRLVQPLFALFTGALTMLLARKLWPEYRNIAVASPWLLIGCVVWAFFIPFVMFDMALAFFVLLGLWGLLLVNGSRVTTGWLLFIIAVALGILAKGPVVLLHLAFPAILAPWWSNSVGKNLFGWYSGLGLALVAAIALVLAWALPAASSGGQDYEQAILWHQTVDRLGQAAPHKQSWWWYLFVLPILLLPWSLWLPIWKAIGNLKISQDPGLRFCLAWIIPTFIVFSILPSKQPHYLLPLLPGCVLVAARAAVSNDTIISRWTFITISILLVLAGIALLVLPRINFLRLPHWSYEIHPLPGIALVVLGIFLMLLRRDNLKDAVIPIALVSVMAVLLIEDGIFTAAQPAYSIENAAKFLGRLESQGEALVNTEKYHGQFHFLGRLTKPFSEITKRNICFWLKNHGHGYAVSYSKNRPPVHEFQPEYSQSYRNHSWLAIWNAKTLCRQVSEFKKNRSSSLGNSNVLPVQ